jgi:hypothetical protein
MSDYTTRQQISDAKVENYWASVERRNAKRRAEYAAAKTRHICCQCKAAPVMATLNHGGGHCKACDVTIRQMLTPEEYERDYGQEA